MKADAIDKSWQAHDALARQAEADWIRLTAAQFERERRGVLSIVSGAKRRALSASSTPDWINLRGELDRWLLAQQETWDDEFEDAAFALSMAHVELWAEELDLDSPDAEFYNELWLDTWLEDFAARTTQSSRDRLLGMILERQNAGDNLDELANALGLVFDDWRDNRTKLLAENETVALGNAASLSAFKGWQLDRKVWITMRDNRVRDAHARTDGQVRAMHEDFDVEGWPAQYPKDPRLPPRLSVNCRCQARPFKT